MRDRKNVLNALSSAEGDCTDALLIEILLDIRDILAGDLSALIGPEQLESGFESPSES